MNHDIFISYSSKQKSIADGVCHYLEDNGFKCWMAPRDIPSGSEYGDLIDTAIITCKVVVLLFSEPASVSKWVKGEINVAFSEGKVIIPFRVDETKIVGGLRVMLNQMHWIDAYPYYAEKLPILLDSLNKILGKQVANSFKNKSIIINGVIMEMVAVVGGTFIMGGTSEQGKEAEADEKPTHRVSLDDYYIGKFEVTQKLWETVTGKNPSHWRGENHPVENVSWNDCQEFIKKLNKITGQNFRLPTEAEWEYAARGGNKSKGYKYSGSNTIEDVTVIGGSQTYPVGAKLPNEIDVYDMSGNVWEWCQDMYGKYSKADQDNPTGPSSGATRVYRGGSWHSNAGHCRVSYRYYNSPDDRAYNLGLRVVMDK